MLKSEFLQRLSKAARELMGKYNGGGADKKTFNWNKQSVVCARNAGLQVLDMRDSHEHGVPTAVRALARTGANILDVDTLIKLEEAWEQDPH